MKRSWIFSTLPASLPLPMPPRMIMKSSDPDLRGRVCTDCCRLLRSRASKFFVNGSMLLCISADVPTLTWRFEGLKTGGGVALVPPHAPFQLVEPKMQLPDNMLNLLEVSSLSRNLCATCS